MIFAQTSSIDTAAQAVQTASRTTFEFGRLHSFTHWGHWALLAAAVLSIVWFVWFMYRRDSVELNLLVGWLLTLLRLTAYIGLLVIYLKPQWRTDVESVINSRVLLLADTSLSMGIDDSPVPSGTAMNSRASQVAKAFGDGGLVETMRQRHDVVVLRFDQDLGRIAAFTMHPRKPEGQQKLEDASAKPQAEVKETPTDWMTVLQARGSETRLGQSLRQLISDERASPLSGIAIFTDGGQNSGVEPAVALQLAREAKIPLYPVGIGSEKKRANVRVSDLLAPARAYPGDSYNVTGYIQAQGLPGQTVTVELLARAAAEGAAAIDPGQVEASEEIVLGDDGVVTPVKFELTPTETGRRSLTLRVLPPPADGNPQDNQFGPIDVEVVEQKTKVLLFAGGPMREYIFLRNLLRRDKDVEVDVLLQTGQPGISQDANKILDEFPRTREELYAYDCVVAFDPDWRELDGEQIDLLERWIGDQAGGMIVVPGQVHTDDWTQAANLAKIRTLYPVEFHKRFSASVDARFGSKEAWPIDFTREGLDAEFLWLADTATESQQAWADFAGVYGYYANRGPKSGATVYAYSSDPAAGEKPVFMAGQFFGAGRVFYLGSGEMYRLRKEDEAYFEQFYTKLIRHVSQGRLLRGSSRGVLLVERDRYLLGNTVAVRAQVNNAQLEPLEAPSVMLEVILPNGELQNVTLKAVPATPGTFAGQFAVYQEGAWRLELPLPDSTDERLTRRIQVKVPDLERENPQRNDALLNELASGTGGKYYLGVDAALGKTGNRPLAEELSDRRRTSMHTDEPKSLWDNKYVMWAIVGILCLEWLIRRVVKLA